MTWALDILIPTARFVFSVHAGAVDVLSEHRSPEAFAEYRVLRDRRPVVGMTTFPNTVLLHGPRTIVVDPGLPLQNDPVLRALEARGIAAADVDLVVLTHAHLDHAGGCGSLAAPVVVHERETMAPHWPQVGGALEALPLRLMTGSGGELAPGLEWALTPGHSPGHVSLVCETQWGRTVLCGDTIGPDREAFETMDPQGPEAADMLASWRRIRAWEADVVVAGHLPPFAP